MSTTRNQMITAKTLEEALQKTQQLAPATQREFRVREAITSEIGWKTVTATLETGRDMEQTAEHLTSVWGIAVEEPALRRLVRDEAYRRRASAVTSLETVKKKGQCKEWLAKKELAEAVLRRFGWPLERRKRGAGGKPVESGTLAVRVGDSSEPG